MRINEVVYTDAEPVDGYGVGFFRIGGKRHDGAVLAGPNGTSAWGGFEDVEPLMALTGSADVLFVGTGADIAPLPASLSAALASAGIGVEMMSSPAACRTYNVLLGEGRRVALAVLPL